MKGRGVNSRRVRQRTFFDTRPSWTAAQLLELCRLHSELGNSWVAIAKRFRGRCDNDVKNIFHSSRRGPTPPPSAPTLALSAYAKTVGANCADPDTRARALEAARAVWEEQQQRLKQEHDQLQRQRQQQQALAAQDREGTASEDPNEREREAGEFGVESSSSSGMETSSDSADPDSQSGSSGWSPSSGDGTTLAPPPPPPPASAAPPPVRALAMPLPARAAAGSLGLSGPLAAADVSMGLSWPGADQQATAAAGRPLSVLGFRRGMAGDLRSSPYPQRPQLQACHDGDAGLDLPVPWAQTSALAAAAAAVATATTAALLPFHACAQGFEPLASSSLAAQRAAALASLGGSSGAGGGGSVPDGSGFASGRVALPPSWLPRGFSESASTSTSACAAGASASAGAGASLSHSQSQSLGMGAAAGLGMGAASGSAAHHSIASFEQACNNQGCVSGAGALAAPMGAAGSPSRLGRVSPVLMQQAHLHLQQQQQQQQQQAWHGPGGGTAWAPASGPADGTYRTLQGRAPLPGDRSLLAPALLEARAERQQASFAFACEGRQAVQLPATQQAAEGAGAAAAGVEPEMMQIWLTMRDE